MDIVLLAAGTSSRMGKVNKLLIPIEGKAMVTKTCLTALEYLSSLDEKSRLIVVTGYKHFSTVKALRPCIEFIEKTSSPVELVIVRNTNYLSGQFSSAKTGIKEVQENSDFFIQLADMPFVTKDHYIQISSYLENHDCVRPFVNEIPAHPVLLSSKLKEIILKKPNNYSVNKVLNSVDVIKPVFTDQNMIKDIDTLKDLN